MTRPLYPRALLPGGYVPGTFAREPNLRFGSLSDPSPDPVTAGSPFSPAVGWFWYWIAQRHWVTLARAFADNIGPGATRWIPSSCPDAAIREWRYCNVFRELDRVTQWIRWNWGSGPAGDHPNAPFAMAVARTINWPETLEDIGFPHIWDPALVSRKIQDRIDRGLKAYTGAYMLRGGQHVLGDTNDKSRYTAFTVLDPLYHSLTLRRHLIPNSMESLVAAIKALPGWGGFLAYEVGCDIARLPGHKELLLDRWAHAGPGAIRGLKRITTRAIGAKLNNGPRGQALAVELMQELYDLSQSWITNRRGTHQLSHLAPTVDRYGWTMREIEHSLCETDKYLRIRCGEGTPRARYTPTT